MTKERKSQPEAIIVNDSQNLAFENRSMDVSIVPQNKAEMWRKINLTGHCRIGGSIFGGSLSIKTGPCFIGQSVFLKEDVRILVDQPNIRNIIRGCIHSERSILIEVSSNVKNSYTVIEGDLYTDDVKLERAFIYGNIQTKNAVIRNSVILGGVIAEKRLNIERSIVGTFAAQKAEIGELVTLILPNAVSGQRIQTNNNLRALLFAVPGRGVKNVGWTFKIIDDDVLEYTSYDQKDKNMVVPLFVTGPGMRALNLGHLDKLIELNAEYLAGKYLQNQKLERNENEEIEWEKTLLEAIERVKDMEIKGTFSIYKENMPDLTEIGYQNEEDKQGPENMEIDVNVVETESQITEGSKVKAAGTVINKVIDHIFCCQCGMENSVDDRYCSSCGAPIDEIQNKDTVGEEERQFCTNCGTEIKRSDVKCNKCGAEISDDDK